MGFLKDFFIGKTKDDYMGEYNKSIKDTKQAQADAVYQQYQDKALYDANKDYFEKAGVSDPFAYSYNKDGKWSNSLQDTIKTYDDYLGQLTAEKDKVARQQKYNIFGDGLIGSTLKPFHQVGTGIQDLATSGISKWQSGERDLLSDLGAAGEVALEVLPFTKAGKALGVGAKSLGGALKNGALMGAGYGASSALSDMGAQDFDLGQLLTRTAIGGGMGAGMNALSHGVGKVWNKYSQPAPSKSTEIIKVGKSPDVGEYQNYLKTLTDNGVDTSSYDAFKKTARKAVSSHHPDRGGDEKVFKALNNAYEAFGKSNDEKMFQDALSKATAPVGNAMPMSTTLPNQSFKQKLGNFRSNLPNMRKDIANSKVGKAAGNVTSKLLKSKTGKLGLGLGSGLLLSKLMNGGSGNTDLNQMTEEELYNYIVNGGQ